MHGKSRWIAYALAAMAVLAAGCGGGGPKRPAWVDREPLPADTMGTPMAETGVHGGRFRVGVASPPRTFNPVVANENSSKDVLDRLYTTLTDVDHATGGDLPLAAKSWEFSADERTVTFHLRRGLRFSDGHPLTAEDVRFSFDVYMDDSLRSAAQEALTWRDERTGERRKFEYSAPDSYTFTVTSPRPFAMMLAATGSIRLLPKHVLEGRWRAGSYASAYNVDTRPESLVTSGPWRLREYVPGEKVELERNPYWYGVDAKGRRLPYLDALVFVVTKDQENASLRFQAGEIDALDNLRPADYPDLQRGQAGGDYRLYELGPSFNANFLWFNLNPAPGGAGKGPAVGPVKYAWFSRKEFRQAVSKAIDRDALIAGPLHGFGYRNWSTMTPGNRLWYDSTLVGMDDDPEGAERLLEGLGMRDRDGDGVREDAAGHDVAFDIATNTDNPWRKEMVNLIREDLAKVGLRATLAPLDFNTLMTRYRNDFQYDAILLGQGSAVPADPGMGQNVWRSSGATHYWRVRSPRPATPGEARVDELMQRIVYTRDMAARRADWGELMRIVNDECWLVWLPVMDLKIPVRAKFGNVAPSPMPHRILWNSERIFERPGAEKP